MTTTTDAAMLSFIARFIEANHYPPNYKEIAASCGLKAKSAVKYHLDRLVRDGKVSYDRYETRSVRVTG